ncbi:Vacuolar protein-sorting-associated protein 27 [Tilletia horrida]|uniref:Vacuolar protein sorting-associated protein 27 n=1 Tax=Tilletia horrida TaxID=155126 RepID=A0AAN6JT11_9BASI|nr:Vacuolar protein-sorting-associated protein 27 [Tilletia horrida]KAK0568932.1 Vacuolar protein-sorting-associated protein 27 [Tilletia horrida]
MSAGWLSWGSDPFAELVEKATSELLPPNHEDVALNLEICDQIRAKQVQPKHAMQTIKKRLGHANPNVVLLTLGLTDICIKNSGDHFLAEVGSAEFMDNLVSILNAGTGPGKNVDVRNKMLRLIQSWAQVADARPAQMSYVERVYSDLKKRGFPFPPPDPSHVVSAALVETLTAPEWADSDVCLRCRQNFTTFTRKHHCRNCGNVFCAACSSNTMSLPWFGIGQDVRVCDGCHTKRGPPSNARRAKPAPPPAPKTTDGLSRSATVGGTAIKSSGRGGVGNAYAAPARSNTVTATSSSSRRKKEEDEIALAIKLSLESAPGSSNRVGPGYVPSAPGASATSAFSALRGPSGRLKEGTDAVREDDPDLAAAIAASLRDYSVPQPSAPSGFSDAASIASMPPTPAPQSEASIYNGGSYMTANSVYNQPHLQQQQQYTAPQQPSEPQLPIPPSIELPPQDVDSLLSFSQTVLRAEEAAARAPGHPFSAQQLHQTISDPQTQGLYDRAQLARPKMARSLDEAGRRHSVLVGMHEKLTEAVKLYNRLLDAQMGRGPQIVYAPGGGQAPGPQQHRRETESLHTGYKQSVSSPAQPSFYPTLPQGPPPGPVHVSSPSAQFQQAQNSGYAALYGAHQSSHVAYAAPSDYASHNSNPIADQTHASTPGAGSSQGGAPWPAAPSGPLTAQSQVAPTPTFDPTGAMSSPHQRYAYSQQQQQPLGHGYGQIPTAPATASQMYGSYGAAQVQSPLQVEAQLPSTSAVSQASVPPSAPQQTDGAAGGSGLASAPSAPTWMPSTSASSVGPAQVAPVQHSTGMPLSQSGGWAGNAPSAPSQQQAAWTPTQTSFAASSPGVNGLPSAAEHPSHPSFPNLAGNDSPSKLANAPSAPQFPPSAPTQEPWRREDERPLIDL